MKNRIEKILFITDKNKDLRRQKIMSIISDRRDAFIQSSNGTHNIVVPPEHKTKKKITFMAHYDVYPESLGYNDNSSGVIALIDIIDKLPFVEFVFSDDEEKGGLGATLYATTMMPDVVIAVDVVGIGDTIFYENTYGINIPEFVSDKWKDKIIDVGNAIFHDAKITSRYMIPSGLIISEYKENEGKIISDIFRYQHNGPEDNKIEHLSEKQLEMVEEFLVDLGTNLYKFNEKIFPNLLYINDFHS